MLGFEIQCSRMALLLTSNLVIVGPCHHQNQFSSGFITLAQ